MENKISDTNETENSSQSDGKAVQGEKKTVLVPATSGKTSRTQDRPPDLVKKIGKTTYLVRVHFSQTSRETLEDKIKRMLRDDVRRIMQAETSM